MTGYCRLFIKARVRAFISFMEIKEYLKDKRRHQDPFLIREGKYRDASLTDSFYRLDWMEDAFLSGNSERDTLTRTFDFAKLKFISWFIIIFLGILLGRVFWLQIIKGDYYYSMAEGNRLKISKIEPLRGIIYDRNMLQLVRNNANFVLYLIPADLPKNEAQRDEALRRLSQILSKNQASASEKVEGLQIISDNPVFLDLKNRLGQIGQGSLESYQPLFIADNIDYDSALKLHLESENSPGIFLSTKIRREYLQSIVISTSTPALKTASLSHIMGYTGKINAEEMKKLGEDYSPIDYVGKTGLEYFWENELKGLTGKKFIEVDALGKEKKIINSEAPRDGYGLVLSLDAELQANVEDILKKHLRQLNLSKGVAIVLDPNNGEILSLVSLPAYDNNSFARGISQEEYSKFLKDEDQPLFNRAVSGEFPSGSTIKPVFSAAALQEGIITEFTSVLSNGGLKVGIWSFPDWKAGGHGMTNVKKAIAESVNTFYYYIGGGYDKFKGLGIYKLMDYARLFGFGKQLGIDLPGEATGFLPNPEWKEKVKGEQWYIGDTYHVAIGQGDFLSTPLQIAASTAVFANGGSLFRPHLVKEIRFGHDEVVRKIEPELVRDKFIDAKNIEIVRAGMRQTVTAGSARSLQALSVPVAGKTGTAQWSSKKAPHAWFTGFAPYNKPQIVVTILVEEGKEGSTVATPIAKEILEYYFSKH